MDTATFSLLAPFLPDAFQPAHFIKTFRECRFTVKASAEIAENIKVVTRFKLRRHHLFHGDNAAVRVVAELIEVVTLKLGGSRQNDIRKAAGRRPLVINGDDRFSLRQPSIMRLICWCRWNGLVPANTHIFSGGNLTDLPFQLMILPGSRMASIKRAIGMVLL